MEKRAGESGRWGKRGEGVWEKERSRKWRSEEVLGEEGKRNKLVRVIF